MAAGLGFKDFTTGEVLTAADVDGYLMQGVWVFASAAARDAAVTSPQEGNFAYLKDTNVTTYYTGSAWANLDTTGMTNPMTTTGDTIYSSSGSTPARLGIGSTGQVLTVAGGIPSWATPASGGGMTLLSTTSLSGTTVSITTIDQTYNDLYIVVHSVTSSGGVPYGRPNDVSNICWTSGVMDGVAQNENAEELWFMGDTSTPGGGSTNTSFAKISNYANTSFYKPLIVYGGSKRSGFDRSSMYGGFIAITGAITSLVLRNSSAGSYTGGTCLIYGVK